MADVMGPCEGCGRIGAYAEMRTWFNHQRGKVLVGRAGGAPVLGPDETLSPTGLYKYVDRIHAYRICWECHEQLAKGTPVEVLFQRRVLIGVGAFLAICGLIALFMPQAIPHLLDAFWRNGAGGR